MENPAIRTGDRVSHAQRTAAADAGPQAGGRGFPPCQAYVSRGHGDDYIVMRYSRTADGIWGHDGFSRLEPCYRQPSRRDAGAHR